MKCRILRRFAFTAVLCVIFLSCESLPFGYSGSRSWSAAKLEKKGGCLGTVQVIGISVDRGGLWDSIEKEVAAMAPLVFLKQGWRTAGEGEAADYWAGIQIREREYTAGWRTKRSLSAELRIWQAGGNGDQDKTLSSLPLAAAQVVSVGERSFSSSKTLSRMFSQAAKKAFGRLRVKKGKN
jgi:hypothetical protein